MSFKSFTEDFGIKPATAPMTEDERKLAAYAMAVNALLVQFIAEGVLPATEQVHFAIHLLDFADRLYHGETLKFDGLSQTMALDSELGNMFVASANLALNSGREEVKSLKAQVNELETKFKQTEQDNAVIDTFKPTVH